MGTLFRGSLLRDQLTLYVFVCVLFIVGVVFGSLLVSALTLDQQQNLSTDVAQFVARIVEGGQADGTAAFWERAAFHAKWLILIWVLGITVVGVPFVLALDFLKGVLVGFAIGTLVSQHEWKGLFFALTSVAPPNLLVVPAILITSVSALSFALFIIKGRLLSRTGTLAEPFLSHTTTFAMMLFAIGAAAMIEAYVTPEVLRWTAPMLADAITGL